MSMSRRLLADGEGGEGDDMSYDLTSVELSVSGETNTGLSNATDNGVHGSRDGVAGDLGDSAELIYASWSKSNAQLMVLDHELRIVLWSRGMVESAFGLEPEIGTSLKALPFPSADHRARAVASLAGVMGEASAGTIFHPDRALSAATHAKPRLVVGEYTATTSVGFLLLPLALLPVCRRSTRS